MKMPTYEPQISREMSAGGVARVEGTSGLTQQCDYLACLGAIAQCAGHPNLQQCIATIAPNCLPCV
jgi:hypothetical protein